MKCIFTGGGTLGHTNPAIAVAEKIRKTCPSTDILFIMRVGGKENSEVSKRGFKIEEIPAEGLQRGGNVIDNMHLCYVTLGAINKCMRIIKSYKPDFIFGTGGYVSFAPLMAGLIKRIPTFIHESNSTPGLVTKMIVRMGATPLVSTEVAKKHLTSKNVCQVVGTPLLSDFNTVTREEARHRLGIGKEKIFIVSFGGSGGSGMLNDVIIDLMNDRSKRKTNILEMHATGEKYFDEAKRKFTHLAKGENGQRIVPRIENMAMYMNAADIVICRCGAATLAELSEVGRAAILIPSPNVTNNHQYENGKRIVDKNAAIMIEEKDLTKEYLHEKILMLSQSKTMRDRLEKNIASFKNGDSSETIANILINSI